MTLKKVEAIVCKTRFNEVKETLNEAGIEFFSFWEVRGVGQAREGRVYRGVVYDTSSIERMYIAIYCREKYVKLAVDAILKSAKTGEVGDGKIFISNIEDGYRIRTGEEGDSSVYLEGQE
jgi:nitrogen regulatory protein P-II 1